MGSKLGPAKAAAVLAGVLLAGTLATACGSGTPATSSTARWTPGGKDVGYTPEFVSNTCPSSQPELKGARCGYLVVPEDRNNPGGRKLHLDVAIIPSTSPHPAADPVVYLTGGPGADAFTSTGGLAEAGVNRNREVISMSQRGTLSTTPTPLTCPEIDKFYQARVGLGVDSPQALSQYLQATTQCRSRLVDKGVNLAAFNTFENAADMADLRTALGIRQWNVYGHSYGTELALTYMRLYPQGIRSVTLDGIVPPSVASLGWTWSSLKESVDNVVAACQAQAPCRARYPDFTTTQFTGLVSQLEAHPVTTTVTVPDVGSVKVVLDGGALVNWWAGASHRAATIPMVLDALASGNPQPLAQQWAEAWYPGSGGKFAWGLSFSVWCSEWVPFEPTQQRLADALGAWPTLPISVLNDGTPQLAQLQKACGVWNVPKAASSIRDVTSSSIPTLEITGSFDAQTGAVWGRYTALTLPHSTTVTLPGVAHGVDSNACAVDIITSFFDDPNAPNSSCLASVQPPPFELGP